MSATIDDDVTDMVLMVICDDCERTPAPNACNGGDPKRCPLDILYKLVTTKRGG
jgi:hypothetical protein